MISLVSEKLPSLDLPPFTHRRPVCCPCSVAWLWRSWLRRLPACTVTLDLRWSHVAVSDDMDPLGSPQGRGASSTHRALADARSPLAARQLQVWYLAEVAQGVLPLAVTELIELCEGLHQVKSVTIPMLNRVGAWLQRVAVIPAASDRLAWPLRVRRTMAGCRR